jgi:hypothetical protein
MTGTRTGGLWVPRSISPHATWAYFVDQPTEPISPQDAGFAASSRMDRVDWRTRVSQPSEWVVDSGQSRSCRWRGGPVSACVSMKLLDQEPCRVCDVVAFPVAADLVIAVGVVAAGFPVAEPEVERRGPVVVVVDAESDLLVTASAGQGLGCVHDRGPDARDRSSGLTAKALNSG